MTSAQGPRKRIKITRPLTIELISPALERYWGYVVKTDSCWNWTGDITDSGYGRIHISNGQYYAHRIAYVISTGQTPTKGMVTDHLCRNRRCVNPEHLELVSITENVMRGQALSALNAKKTHCMRGHPLSGDNLYIAPKGYRSCKLCRHNAKVESDRRLKRYGDKEYSNRLR